MARSNSHGRETTEFVLGTLNDDSDDDLESLSDQPLDYETATLKEITDLNDELEKVRNKIIETIDKAMYDNFAEYIMQIIIKLDNIDAKNFSRIREARKETILFAQGTLEKLDNQLYAGKKEN